MELIIDKKSPIPLYLQVEEQLRQKFEQGEYLPNQRLPSERQISEQLDISRLTVRKALSELANENLIYTSTGKGTFVAEPRFRQELPILTGFSEDMRQLGLNPSAVLVEGILTPATNETAEHLKVEIREEIIQLKRVRLANEQPVQLVTEYIRHDMCPGLLKFDWNNRSLYKIFRKQYGLKLLKAEQSIAADLATKEEAQLLQTSTGWPVLRLKRTTFLEDGIPISFSKAVYRGDRFAFNVVLYGGTHEI